MSCPCHRHSVPDSEVRPRVLHSCPNCTRADTWHMVHRHERRWDVEQGKPTRFYDSVWYMECSMCGMIEFDPETHHARLERDKRVLCCLWVDVQETIRRTRVLAGEEPQ